MRRAQAKIGKRVGDVGQQQQPPPPKAAGTNWLQLIMVFIFVYSWWTGDKG
jgi:hypothetical protein